MSTLREDEFHLPESQLRAVAENTASGRWVRPLAQEVLDLRASIAEIRTLADRWSKATVHGVLSDEERPDLVARGFAAQLLAVVPEQENRA